MRLPFYGSFFMVWRTCQCKSCRRKSPQTTAFVGRCPLADRRKGFSAVDAFRVSQRLMLSGFLKNIGFAWILGHGFKKRLP